jgi:hypothetical protein
LKNYTEVRTILYDESDGDAAQNLLRMKKLMGCKTYESAGACCVRTTNSSVVDPMISFAGFNGTHRILPIESWVDHFCKNNKLWK